MDVPQGSRLQRLVHAFVMLLLFKLPHIWHCWFVATVSRL
jgi:hypothetical protein